MHDPMICRRLFIASVLASTALARAHAQEGPPADFSQYYRALMERFIAKSPDVIRDYRILRLAGNARPWLDTDLNLEKGEYVSLLAAGQVVLSRAANLALLPRVVLWGRVGDGAVFRPGSDTHTFRAGESGRLQLATLQGRWSTPRGDHPAPSAYDTIEGAIEVLVIRWRTSDTQQSLAALASLAQGDELVAAALAQTAAAPELPKGFEPLWFVGSGDNFSQRSFDGEPAIALRSELNAGIIRAPLDLPLSSGLTLAWEWRVNQLPSVRAEDAIPFHQYASIALEFDDGQDLTWYWSAALDPERHYRCPFPSWPGETHLVARSGSEEQGRWVAEKRDVQRDVDKALTNKPTRIKGVWLIATTVFGARPASVDFRRLRVIDAAGKTHVVFPT